MRKIKKQTNNSNAPTQVELETLSTIPPLILENDLGNGNYLMSSTKDDEKKTQDNSKCENDGKILFSTDSNFAKKRKMKESSSSEDSESTSSEDEDGEIQNSSSSSQSD